MRASILLCWLICRLSGVHTFSVPSTNTHRGALPLLMWQQPTVWSQSSFTTRTNQAKTRISSRRTAATSHTSLNAANGDETLDTKKTPIDNENRQQQQQLDWGKIGKQAKLFWEMAIPYYKESNAGRWLFAGMIGLTLLNSGVSVVFSYVGKDFWNALSAKNTEEFYIVLWKYLAALGVGAPIVTMYRYQKDRLAVHWREWMTDRTLQLYQDGRVYYALERQVGSGSGAIDQDGESTASDIVVDNPDQRIAEDVKSFTSFSLTLFLSIVTSIIDLVSFSLILYSIYPQLFVAIVGYAAFGTVTTTFLGKDLVRLNYDQLSKEANFRYSLVRLRDNAESIAFYKGEDLEGRAIGGRLKDVMENTRLIVNSQRNLEFFTNGYRFLIQLLPVTVVAPRYFAGAIELGVISQSVGAFNHILNDLSIIVNQFEQLSRFSAGIDRLSVFLQFMRDADLERDASIPLLQLSGNQTTTEGMAGTDGEAVSLLYNETEEVMTQMMKSKEFGMIDLCQLPPVVLEENGFASPSKTPILSVNGLDLCTPDRKRLLIKDLTMSLQEGDNLLICGSSGAGKSSLLRGIAGLWTAGNGRIVRPADSDVYFLPQRPYCTLGTLKDQLLYPSLDSLDSDDYPEGHVLSRSHLLKQTLSDQDLLDVLGQVDLGDLAERVGDGDSAKGLETTLDWSNTLSLGEQQRLAFGRVLVNQPKLVILDEATAALDMVAEAKMYSLLQNLGKKQLYKNGKMSAPGLTYVSVGHRPSLLAYHDQRLRLNGGDKYALEKIEKVGTDIQSFNISNL